jgi:hypothetical protein
MSIAYKNWDAEQTLERLEGDTACLCVMIEMIVDQAPALLDSIEAPQASGSALTESVHTLKNIFGVLNASTGFELAERMQGGLRSGQTISAADRRFLARQLQSTVQELVQFHASHQDSGKSPLPGTGLIADQADRNVCDIGLNQHN